MMPTMARKNVTKKTMKSARAAHQKAAEQSQFPDGNFEDGDIVSCRDCGVVSAAIFCAFVILRFPSQFTVIDGCHSDSLHAAAGVSSAPAVRMRDNKLLQAIVCRVPVTVELL